MPILLLAALSLLSLGVRVAWLGDPCRAPCRTAAEHELIFDESYYVNAARAIAGVRSPPGSDYAGAPRGVDPNSEHPPLAKLVIAGGIRVLGDGPLAWRLGSLLCGSLAILGTFALVRAAGAGRWGALGASALMAADNLLLVHGRIGTLDIYVLASMIWAAVLYLRRRPLAAGVVIGVGACLKLVAFDAVLVLALLEGARVLARRHRRSDPGDGRRRLTRIAVCTATSLIVFTGLLALLDRIAPPYDPGRRALVSGGVFGHIAHMLRYAAAQVSPHGPAGIASYPWQWLVDLRPIPYLTIDIHHPTPGLAGLRPDVHFLGVINPAILLFALPALALAARRAWRDPQPRSDVDVVSVAWFLGTYVPFVLLSAIAQRTSYLYYMVIVMPGIYIAVSRLFAGRRPRLVIAWVAAVLLGTVLLYPFTPLPSL